MEKPLMSDRTYDFLRAVVTMALPAIGTFYFAIAGIWMLPYSNEVVGTLAAAATLGGVLLKIARNKYDDIHSGGGPFDGELVINTDDPMKDVYAMSFDVPLDELTDQKTLTIRVRNENV